MHSIYQIRPVIFKDMFQLVTGPPRRAIVTALERLADDPYLRVQEVMHGIPGDFGAPIGCVGELTAIGYQVNVHCRDMDNPVERLLCSATGKQQDIGSDKNL